jgi:hypothetical protein
MNWKVLLITALALGNASPSEATSCLQGQRCGASIPSFGWYHPHMATPHMATPLSSNCGGKRCAPPKGQPSGGHDPAHDPVISIPKPAPEPEPTLQ